MIFWGKIERRGGTTSWLMPPQLFMADQGLAKNRLRQKMVIPKSLFLIWLGLIVKMGNLTGISIFYFAVKISMYFMPSLLVR